MINYGLMKSSYYLNESFPTVFRMKKAELKLFHVLGKANNLVLHVTLIINKTPTQAFSAPAEKKIGTSLT